MRPMLLLRESLVIAGRCTTSLARSHMCCRNACDVNVSMAADHTAYRTSLIQRAVVVATPIPVVSQSERGHRRRRSRRRSRSPCDVRARLDDRFAARGRHSSSGATANCTDRRVKHCDEGLIFFARVSFCFVEIADWQSSHARATLRRGRVPTAIDRANGRTRMHATPKVALGKVARL